MMMCLECAKKLGKEQEWIKNHTKTSKIGYCEVCGIHDDRSFIREVKNVE